MATKALAMRAWMIQLCAARRYNNVAGFQTITEVLDNRGHFTSNTSVFSAGVSRLYATGNQPDSAEDITGAAKTTESSGDIGEEMRVDTWVVDELEEPKGGPKPGVQEKVKQAASAVGEKVKDAGKAISDATDNETVKKVGDTVKGAGDAMKGAENNKPSLGKEDVVTS